MRFAGETAALSTALLWGAGSNFFAEAGKTMGAIVLNRLRITMALALLVAALLAARGSPWPFWASGREIALLAASGLVGFVFGDNFYFRSMLILGPGRGSTLACLAPPMAALLAVPLLRERLGPMALLGMVITLGGVAWTLLEREHAEHPHFRGSIAAGVAAGALGALGQAGGLVLSKLALREGIDPLSATVIRVASATACVWLVAAAAGHLARSVRALRHPRATLSMLGGAFCGPFLGVTLSLYAVSHTETGVAASIMAFYPIPTILISSRVHGEAISARTLAGACVAIAGIIVLFLR
jgi:drug/metabolite transporter (DMT)-like permease